MNNELMHYGIKGMKWRRRKKNSRGTPSQLEIQARELGRRRASRDQAATETSRTYTKYEKNPTASNFHKAANSRVRYGWTNVDYLMAKDRYKVSAKKAKESRKPINRAKSFISRVFKKK